MTFSVLYVCGCGFEKVLVVDSINERAERPAHFCRIATKEAA